MVEVASERVQGIGKVVMVVSWVYSCMWMEVYAWFVAPNTLNVSVLPDFVIPLR